MNGANIGTFDPSTPADTESLGLADDRQRSIKTTFQQVMDDEHNFPAAGGSVVGYHRLGSGRAFFAAQSLVSSSGTDGRFMVASDTSRLFGVGSGGTVLLGAGPGALSIGSVTAHVSFPQRTYWVEEIGLGVTGSDAAVTVTFPNSGFSGTPFTQLTNQIIAGGNPALLSVKSEENATTFTVYSKTDGSGSGASVTGSRFFWRSAGTRVL